MLSTVRKSAMASTGAGRGGIAYTSAKHGLLGLTRQVSLDHGHTGIHINAVLPGPIDTQMIARVLAMPQHPLNMNADQKPFFAGTYFPKVYFLDLLKAISEKWAEDQSALLNQGESITEALDHSAHFSQTPQAVPIHEDSGGVRRCGKPAGRKMDAL